MPFSHAWRDYNIQRQRRYRHIPKLIALARGYLKATPNDLYTLIEAAERAEQLRDVGLALLGEQFEAEKNLSRHIRTVVVHCHHHPALLAKNDYMDVEHELLDADAHLHALHTLIIGSRRARA